MTLPTISPSDTTKKAGLAALQTDITALAALPQTAANAQLLLQKQQSLVRSAEDANVYSAASIIAAFPLRFTTAWLAANAPAIAQITTNIANNPLTAAGQGSALTAAQVSAVDLAMAQNLIGAAEVLNTLVAPFTLGTFATTGTAGGFTCAASAAPLVTGQKVTVAGTYGGTGSLVGYSNPTTYLLGATNGSTTGTLLNGATAAAITSTAGTPSGITVTVHSP